MTGSISHAFQAGTHSLDLGNLALTSLPEMLGHLPSLGYLDLSGNLLATLPKSLCRLPDLRQLVCVGCALPGIPSTIWGLHPECTIHFSRMPNGEEAGARARAAQSGGPRFEFHDPFPLALPTQPPGMPG